MDYPTVFENSNATCSSEYELAVTHGQHETLTVSDCLRMCISVSSCSYYFFNSFPSCYLFSDCRSYQNSSHSGTTWHLFSGMQILHYFSIHKNMSIDFETSLNAQLIIAQMEFLRWDRVVLKITQTSACLNIIAVVVT